MDPNTFPTKGNLILAKNTLRLSNQGYELLDKKRNVLIKEIMELDEKAKEIQAEINDAFALAYGSLQHASVDLGISNVERFSYGVPIEQSLNVKTRSIMGVEIPLVTFDDAKKDIPNYGLLDTGATLDQAFLNFNYLKEKIIELSMVESTAYRLAVAIKKTQKRANALKNVTIPRYVALVKLIAETLEERERDEFTRLKVIKKKK